MTSALNRKSLSGEEIASALTLLGEDATVQRIEQLQVLVDADSLPSVGRDEAVMAAVDAARRALDATSADGRKFPPDLVDVSVEVFDKLAGAARKIASNREKSQYFSAEGDLIGEVRFGSKGLAVRWSIESTMLPEQKENMADRDGAQLNEDATAERIEQLQVRIGSNSLPVDGRDEAALVAVDAARRALDAKPIGDREKQEPKSSAPTLDDLTVSRRDAEILEVSSWLTRGRCATVYKFAFSDNYSVQPFLIGSYMQGITTDLILKAVKGFVQKESAMGNHDTAENVDRQEKRGKRIEALFLPESWTDGAPLHTPPVVIGSGRIIDVTEQVLSLSLNEIHSLEDDTETTNDLVDAEHRGHHGPHRIKVTEQVKLFFGIVQLSDLTQAQLDAARTAAGVENNMQKSKASFSRNAILVYEAAGAVIHAFMPENEARELLDKAAQARGGGAMFACEPGEDASLHFAISPDLQERVQAAKDKLRTDLRWQSIMDKHGVPKDPDVRESVAVSIREIVENLTLENLSGLAQQSGHCASPDI